MPDNHQSNRRIARNSLFLSIRMVIVLCISLYTTRVTLQILGVEDYGVYNVVCGFVSMFAFLNTSMSNGIQRFYNFELGKNGEDGANRVFNTSLLIQLLLGLVIALFTESFGLWYLHNKMVIPEGRMFAAEWIFQFSIVSFIFIVIQAPYTAAVMAHEKMDFYAVVSVLDAFLKLGMVFLLPVLKFDQLVFYGLFLTLISVFDFCLYFVYCKKKFSEIYLSIDRVKNEKKLFGSMLGFSGWNMFGSFSNMMRDQGINLILNLFFGPVVNAARGVAMQINTGITGLVSSILTPVRPQVIQSYAKGDINRSLHLTYSISKFCLCFLFLLSLPICVEIDFILKVWLGDSIPEHTQAFVIIILLTSSILIPMGAQATLVHASGKMRNYQVIGSTVKILSVPITFFLMKLGYAPEWALLMVLLFDAVGLIVGMFIIKTLMPFDVWHYIKNVFLPLIPTVIFAFVIVCFLHNIIDDGLVRFLIVLVVGSIVILIVFYLTGMSKSEKLLVVNMIRSKFKSKVV